MNDANLVISEPEIVMLETPNEISLAFPFIHCNRNCKGCHWSEINKTEGTELTSELFEKYLQQYEPYISCVLFFGGEWNIDGLMYFLKCAKDAKLKTALYTGAEENELPKELLENITYLKTGAYIEELGGLSSPNTNQRYKNLETNEDMTHIFSEKRRDV